MSPSKVDFMHYRPKILPIFYYVILCKRRAHCTEIDLKLRNAMALMPPYDFTSLWTMRVYRY